jgi:O-acetylserine/cysteine efflux transporter
MPKDSRLLPRHAFFAILTALIWGVNFVEAKAGVAYYPPFLFLALRLAIVGMVLLPFVEKPLISWKHLFLISLNLAVLHWGLMFTGLKLGLDASIAVLVEQLRVPFLMILSALFFKERLPLRGVIGIGLAIVGTFFIVGSPNASSNVAAIFMMVGSAFFWAVYSILLKQVGKVNAYSLIAYISLLSVPQFLVLSAVFESNQLSIIQASTVSSILSLIYVAIVTTLVAHGLWYFLLARYQVNQVAPFSLLVPVFGVLAALFTLHETLSLQVGLGSLLTVAGVALIVFKK